MPASWDEDQLFDALKAALKASASVPPEFIRAGQDAYAWLTIDAELAQLTYDSARDVPAGLRSEPAAIQAMTFTSDHLTIELEVGEDCLHGQVIPTRPGTVEVVAPAGTVSVSQVDDLGSFAVLPIPPRPFRLSFIIPGGNPVQTSWITF